MHTPLPSIILELQKALTPHKIYLVGGAVRNRLQNKPWPEDLDLATTATPDLTIKAMKALSLRPNTRGQSFGVISTKAPNHTIEIATLRQETYTPGSRYPKVTFITDLKQDSHRRDFTINAIYLEIHTTGQTTPHDFHNGIEDLKNKKVRFIGNKEERLKQDPTRQQRYEKFVKELENTKEKSGATEGN